MRLWVAKGNCYIWVHLGVHLILLFEPHFAKTHLHMKIPNSCIVEGNTKKGQKCIYETWVAIICEWKKPQVEVSSPIYLQTPNIFLSTNHLSFHKTLFFSFFAIASTRDHIVIIFLVFFSLHGCETHHHWHFVIAQLILHEQYGEPMMMIVLIFEG